MAQVIVRQLDAAVIEIHRRQAKARGVSLEQELREVITRARGPGARSWCGGSTRSGP